MLRLEGKKKTGCMRKENIYVCTFFALEQNGENMKLNEKLVK
jgi:hypothetical protein